MPASADCINFMWVDVERKDVLADALTLEIEDGDSWTCTGSRATDSDC